MTLSKAAADQAAISDVFSGRDSGGDDASPAVAEQQQAPLDAPQEAKKEEPAASPPVPEQREAPQEHRVPLSELMAEREKRKLEARLREEAEANARKYRDEAEAMSRRFAAQRQQQQAPEPPDPMLEPERALAYQAQQLRGMQLNDRANFSERLAIRTYGKELVDKARDAAIQAGVAQHFYHNSPDPYDDAIAWYKEHQFRTEVGADPEAYKKRIQEEARKQVLEELKAGGQAQQQPKFPQSLADATQAGQQGGNLTQEAAISGVFAPDRGRRR